MKRAGWIAAGLLVLVVPLLLMSVVLVIAGDQSVPSRRAIREVPAELLGLYRSAATTCEGLDWTVLAAIHKVETNFGTGPVTSSKGAQGPMQFMRATFDRYETDGDGDRRADIDNVADAVFSAARLLCANGAGEPARLATSIWNYNHSDAYVSEVLNLAAAYGTWTSASGAALAGSSDLLDSPRVVLTPTARADVEAGLVDARLVGLLSWLSERHTIGVTVFKTGHSIYVDGTERISNHVFGRAADIFFVDGAPVSVANPGAYALVLGLKTAPPWLRPTELGHPFGAIGYPGGFTDADHADHLHIAFD